MTSYNLNKKKFFSFIILTLLVAVSLLPINNFVRALEPNNQFTEVLNNDAKLVINNKEFTYDSTLDEFIYDTKEEILDINTYLSNEFTSDELLAITSSHLEGTILKLKLNHDLVSFYITNDELSQTLIKNDINNKNYKLSLNMSSLVMNAKINNNVIDLSLDNKLVITHDKASDVLADATELSAIIKDINNNILYYGKINDALSSETIINLPNDLIDGNYQLLVYASKDNGINLTNYNSKMAVINFSILRTVVETTTPEVTITPEPTLIPEPTLTPEPSPSTTPVVDEYPCDDPLCSHVYRDLNGELVPLCQKGKAIIMAENPGLYGDERFLDGEFGVNVEKNVLAGKNATIVDIPSPGTDNRFENSAFATDGIHNNSSNYLEMGSGNRCIEFDLEDTYILNRMHLWRYYDGRTYNGTIVVVSDTKDFKNATVLYNSDINNRLNTGYTTSIFNNAYDSTYQETANGKELFNAANTGKEVSGRYIRIYMSGNSTNQNNHIVEVELYGKLKDPYYNQGIYFVSIPNVVHDRPFFSYDHDNYRYTVERVDAYFACDNDENFDPTGSGWVKNPKVYRMVEIKEGVFSTVVPPTNNNNPYVNIYFKIDRINQSDPNKTRDTIFTKVKYKFNAEGDIKDRIIKEYNDTTSPYNSGLGELSYKPIVRDCFYWNNNYLSSYWGGRPSYENRLIEDEMIYIDNDADGEYQNTQDDFYWNANIGRLWISYYDRVNNKFISDEIINKTHTNTIDVYTFPKNLGLVETSLLIISNAKLMVDTNGELISADPNITDLKIHIDVLNLNSGDNSIVLRNLDNTKRIYTKFETKVGKLRHIAFRDQLFDDAEFNDSSHSNYKGNLVSYERDYNEHKRHNLYYKIGTTQDLSNVDMKKMYLHIKDVPGIDKYKLFFTEKGYDESYKYIQFFIGDRTSFKQTDILEIDMSYAYPCFFADVLQDNAVNRDDNLITGAWTSVYRGSYHGDDVTLNNVPIERNKTYNSEYYYADANLYDYYTDTELQGFDLQTTDKVHNTSHRTGIFNKALENYYKINNNSIPIYLCSESSLQHGINDTNIFYNFNIKIDKLNNSQINGWTDSGDYLSTGYVSESLDKNGNLTTGEANNKMKVPLFDESFIRGDNSFKTALGYVYNNVSFPFKLNKDGYWEFDSLKNEYATRLKRDYNNKYYLDLTNKPVTTHGNLASGSNVNSYFPFNDDNLNNAGDDAKKKKLNYLFGTKLELTFNITPDGTVIDNYGRNVPITFEFSGDDDFVAYIDGKLALDMMGIHNAYYGQMNFDTGHVRVGKMVNSNGTLVKPNNTSLQSNLYTDKGFNKANLSQGLHTLTIFYLERGQGTSNLKIQFNFPRQNRLDITNQVDTSSASSIFKECLEHVGSFEYGIKNQATSGYPLDAANSPGSIKPGKSIVFVEKGDNHLHTNIEENKFEDAQATGNVGAILNDRTEVIELENLNKNNEDYITMSKLIESGKYWNYIALNESIQSADLSKAVYMKFEVYNHSIASSDGQELYIKLVDENNNVIYGSADLLRYNSYSNAMPENVWSNIRIDLSKLRANASNFDITKVRKIGIAFACNKGHLYIDNIDFKSAIESLPSIGFSLNDDDISDYNSLSNACIGNVCDYTKGYLSPIVGAWYHLGDIAEVVTNHTTLNPIAMDLSSDFDLAHNQKATFIDRFREGSYIRIEQTDAAKNPAFDTTWSILENAKYENGKYVSGYVDDNYLALFKDKYTVVNDPDILNNSIRDQKEVNGTSIADDDRIVLNGKLHEIAPIYANNSDAKREFETFVYRSYIDPDNLDKDDLNLTVAFENKLISGGIILTKKLDKPAETDRTYKFHIHYNDVMGIYLENTIHATNFEGNGLLQEVSITVPKGQQSNSIAIYGIPKNTKYTIHEINDNPYEVVTNITASNNGYEYTASNGMAVDVVNEAIEENIDLVNSNYKVLTDKTLAHEIIKDSNGNVMQDISYKIDGYDITYKAVEGVVNHSIAELSFTDKYQPGSLEIIKSLDNSTYSVIKPFVFHVHYNETDGNNSLKEVVKEVVVEVPPNQVSASTTTYIPLDTEYWVHEVNDIDLTKIESNNESTDKVIEDTNEKLCTNNNQLYTKYAIGKLESNVNDIVDIINFTNNGSNSVTIKKYVGNNETPLVNVGFSVFKLDGTKETLINEAKTTYHKIVKIDPNDQKYDASHNRYDKQYIVHKDNSGGLYCYVPLTTTELEQYEKGQLSNVEVVAIIVFDNLARGSYIVRETSPRNGYEGLNSDISFTLPYDGNSPGLDTSGYLLFDSNMGDKDIQYKVKNEIKKNGTFEFKKQNIEGHSLTATFALYRYIGNDNSKINELIKVGQNGSLNDQDGIYWQKHGDNISSNELSGMPIAFTGLELNPNVTYRLVEIIAPDGYVKPEGQWNISFNELTNKFQIDVVGSAPGFKVTGANNEHYILINYRTTYMPNTGGRGNMQIYGLVMMAGALSYWIYIVYKKKNKTSYK